MHTMTNQDFDKSMRYTPGTLEMALIFVYDGRPSRVPDGPDST
jgi:hypothetical protein